MAFRDINDAGGVVDGCKLTDTPTRRARAIAVDMATQLVQIKKVPVIIGGIISRVNPDSNIGDRAGKSRAGISGLFFTDTHSTWS
jgi:hypothetical protein